METGFTYAWHPRKTEKGWSCSLRVGLHIKYGLYIVTYMNRNFYSIPNLFSNSFTSFLAKNAGTQPANTHRYFTQFTYFVHTFWIFRSKHRETSSSPEFFGNTNESPVHTNRMLHKASDHDTRVPRESDPMQRNPIHGKHPPSPSRPKKRAEHTKLHKQLTGIQIVKQHPSASVVVFWVVDLTFLPWFLPPSSGRLHGATTPKRQVIFIFAETSPDIP